MWRKILGNWIIAHFYSLSNTMAADKIMTFYILTIFPLLLWSKHTGITVWHYIVVNNNKPPYILPTFSCGREVSITSKKKTKAAWGCHESRQLQWGDIATMSTMAKEAGLNSKITNQSLRKKTSQDLLAQDVPDNLICQLTGHRNVNCFGTIP